jgi:nucleoside-diphosphate-sugar epimerase
MSENFYSSQPKITVGIVGAKGFIGKHVFTDLSKEDFDLDIFARENSPLDRKHKSNKKIVIPDDLIWADSGVNPLVAENNIFKIDEELRYCALLLKEIAKKVPSLRIVYLNSGSGINSGQETPYLEKSIAKGTNAYGKMKL